MIKRIALKINVIFGKTENVLGSHKVICDLCDKNYETIFDSILRVDYSMPGKGKLHEYHMCKNCRKSVLDMLEINQ